MSIQIKASVDSLGREEKVSTISPLEGDENVEGKEIKL